MEYSEAIDDVIEKLSERRIGDFALKVLSFEDAPALWLDCIEELYYHFVFASDPDHEDFSYLGDEEIYRLGVNFVISCLKKRILDSRRSFDSYALDVYQEASDDLLEALREGGYDTNMVFRRIETLATGDISENPLILEVLEHLNEENATVAASLVCYLEDIDSLETLKKKQFYYTEAYTKQDLSEENAKRTFTTFCYFFLEQADSAECSFCDKAMRKIKKAETAREFIMAVSEQDVWLGYYLNMSGAMFPYSTYRLITDPTYEPAFLIT